MTDAQVPDRRPHGFQRRGADRRVEAAEHGVVLPTPDPSGPKAIPEEIKLDVRICRFAFPVLAVNDFGFRRMQLEVALRQSILKLGPEGFCFSLAPAVYQSIIGIPTPGKVGVRPRYPEIERVMHEQIRQNRTDHTTLWGAAVSHDYRSIFLDHRRCQPSFDVEQRPFARHVFPDGPQQKRVVDVVEQALDVKFKNPVVFPASLARDADGVKSRFSRPVTVGIWQEYRV